MSKRSKKIDFLKGIAIILVVFAHSIQFSSGHYFFEKNLYFENSIFKIIYSFHMPLFMIISGYLFYYSVAKNNFWKNVHNRVMKNLVPIIAWSVIPITINLLSLNAYSIYNIAKAIVAGVVYNLWFLWAVLLCSIVVLLCNKFFKDSIMIYILLFIVSLFIPNILNFNLYVFMFPYFVFGYLYNKSSREIDKNINWKIIIFGLLFIYMLNYYNYDCYIYNTGTYILNNFNYQIFIDIYRYLIGFVGSVFIILLVIKFFERIPNKIRNLIAMIGERSFIIYIITDYLFAYVIKEITYSFSGVNYLLCIIGTIILIIMSNIVYMLLKKIKLTNVLLLGNRSK